MIVYSGLVEARNCPATPEHADDQRRCRGSNPRLAVGFDGVWLFQRPGEIALQVERILEAMIGRAMPSGRRTTNGPCGQLACSRKHDVYWFEEPLPPDNLHDYVLLRNHSPLPIAGGEVLTRRQSFVPWLQQRAFDIVQPDVTKVGGMSEERRIAWMAEENGIRFIPHGWNTALGLAADLQYSDYLKMTVYHNLGGTRMETYVTSHHDTIFGDLPIEESLQFEYRIMNYREREYEELPYTGIGRRSAAWRMRRGPQWKSGRASTWTSPIWT
jgi:hypothetical protein